MFFLIIKYKYNSKTIFFINFLMKNFKSNLSKNSKFNTINFNEKNILTRQVNSKI